MKTPKLILITNFIGQEIDNSQTVVTKLIGKQDYLWLEKKK